MMPVPPPSGDMYHRLLVLSEILDKAVAEVRHAIADAKGEPGPDDDGGPDKQAGSSPS